MQNASLYLRSLLLLLAMISTAVVWSFVCLLAAPLPYRKRYYITSRWNVFAIWAAKVICGIRYRVIGRENLPDQPAILLAKHQSAWETIFLLSDMPRPLVYVFKKELLYLPFFGWGLALLRMIPIDRSNGKFAFQAVVEQGRRRLADGLWVIMFPEGTRTAPGTQGKYKSGGTRLAVATNTVVVPIALNSGECWPKNSFIKRPGTITVSIGKPIAPDGLSPDELLAKVESWVEAEMRVISPAMYPKDGLRKKA